VPFDGTQSLSASANVARVVNLTQRNYAYMRPGAGFHGSLNNVNVSSDSSIDHLNIDKSPRLHARAISEVLAVVGGHRMAVPGAPQPTSVSAPASSETEGGTKAGPGGDDAAKPKVAPAAPATPPKSGDGTMNSTSVLRPVAESGTPIIALPERGVTRASSDASTRAAPLRKPELTPSANPAQLPD
jgi:hypothetical protein